MNARTLVTRKSRVIAGDTSYLSTSMSERAGLSFSFSSEETGPEDGSNNEQVTRFAEATSNVHGTRGGDGETMSLYRMRARLPPPVCAHIRLC